MRGTAVGFSTADQIVDVKVLTKEVNNRLSTGTGAGFGAGAALGGAALGAVAFLSAAFF